jgi:hypothetical protein
MAEEKVWLIESPITMIEGEEIAYSINWLGASRVEDPYVAIYKNGEEITSEVLSPTDENVISGNVLTLKRILARLSDGGSRYIVLVEALVNGNKERRKLLIQVANADLE